MSRKSNNAYDLWESWEIQCIVMSLLSKTIDKTLYYDSISILTFFSIPFKVLILVLF